MQELDPDKIKIPSMVQAELLFGAEKSHNRADNLKKVRKFLSVYQITAFDSDAADIYAVIRSETEKTGTLVGPNDLVIAATVISINATLITNNTNEFRRIKSLKIDDWTL
jgi:tRNA(fMet)-specific endonuclease VapC